MGVLGGDRLLHLHQQVGAAPDLGGVRHDHGAGGGIVLVVDARARPCAGLHEHLVPAARELIDAGRRDGDAVLVVLDLGGDADAHVDAPG